MCPGRRGKGGEASWGQEQRVREVLQVLTSPAFKSQQDRLFGLDYRNPNEDGLESSGVSPLSALVCDTRFAACHQILVHAGLSQAQNPVRLSQSKDKVFSGPDKCDCVDQGPLAVNRGHGTF